MKKFKKEPKKLPTITCSGCGKKITREDLKYSQEGTMLYEVSFDKEGNIVYEEEEFITTDSGTFYHPDCDTDLDYKEVEKLGVNY